MQLKTKESHKKTSHYITLTLRLKYVNESIDRLNNI